MRPGEHPRCHPPATSVDTWTKVEHRLFCHISQSCRRRHLISRQVTFNAIAATKTSAGPRGFARRDERDHPKPKSLTDTLPRST
jgi:hypothetical protein